MAYTRADQEECARRAGVSMYEVRNPPRNALDRHYFNMRVYGESEMSRAEKIDRENGYYDDEEDDGWR